MAEPLVLDVGAVAHGGHCVARHADGRVVFVRHALPGERVEAVVTEDHGSYLHADAVRVRDASPDRVPAPCPYAGPGRCGGCDWQHVRPDAQRALKRAVVLEQFGRLARLDVGDLLASVEELPGGSLGWRSRIEYAVDAEGVPGLRRHRSHEVEPVARCLLGVPGVGDAALLRERWPGLTGVSAVRGEGPEVAVLERRPGPGRHARGRRPPDRVTLASGPARLAYSVGSHILSVAADGFWQVHPAAASAYAAAVLAMAEPLPGETVLELYAGAGALTVPLAEAVGPAGRVVALESAADAVADAEENLRPYPWVSAQRARVRATTIAAAGVRPDLVVLDPPRAGAGAEVMGALLALAPRAMVYVACDPASLARDVGSALAAGWRLTALRAFDAFPMTHHVECIALLTPSCPG